MPDPLTTPHEDALAEAMAQKFSSPYGNRNPDWDWEQPDGPDNPYYFTRTLSERADGAPYVHFTDTDGHRSFRAATFRELAAALVETGAVVPMDGFPGEEMVAQVTDAAFGDLTGAAREAAQGNVRTILAALSEVLAQSWCHCGRPVAGWTEEAPAGQVLCAECASVRCDAYPNACHTP